jgi:hypothetical protein
MLLLSAARLPPLRRGPWRCVPASQQVCPFQERGAFYTHVRFLARLPEARMCRGTPLRSMRRTSCTQGNKSARPQPLMSAYFREHLPSTHSGE